VADRQHQLSKGSHTALMVRREVAVYSGRVGRGFLHWQCTTFSYQAGLLVCWYHVPKWRFSLWKC